MHDIVVVEEFRGQSISHLLLHKVEKMALEKKCCKITPEVLEGNIPAKSSYIKFGLKDYELDPIFGKAVFWERSCNTWPARNGAMVS